MHSYYNYSIRVRYVRCSSDEAEDPAALPIYWVSKWVDYSDKYGIGYQLSDNSIGVLFNDSTRLLLTSNAEYVAHFAHVLVHIMAV